MIVVVVVVDDVVIFAVVVAVVVNIVDIVVHFRMRELEVDTDDAASTTSASGTTGNFLDLSVNFRYNR